MDASANNEERMQQFRKLYGSLVKREAYKLCKDKEIASLLTEIVFRRVEKEYAFKKLPQRCEAMLIGRVNLVYAQTGTDRRAIEDALGALQPKEEPAAETAADPEENADAQQPEETEQKEPDSEAEAETAQTGLEDPPEAAEKPEPQNAE